MLHHLHLPIKRLMPKGSYGVNRARFTQVSGICVVFGFVLVWVGFFLEVVWFIILFMVARQDFSNGGDSSKFGGIRIILVENAGPFTNWTEES